MPRRKPIQHESESEDSGDDQSQDLEVGEPPKIDPYTVLGLEKRASEDEIKKAYRKAALQHHPGTVHPLQFIQRQANKHLKTKHQKTRKMQHMRSSRRLHLHMACYQTPNDAPDTTRRVPRASQ